MLIQDQEGVQYQDPGAEDEIHDEDVEDAENGGIDVDDLAWGGTVGLDRSAAAQLERMQEIASVP